MTTYKQNVPEHIWVSPAIYIETLRHLDPFQVHARKPSLPAFGPSCGHLVTASYGCESCFLSHEEIAREAREFELELESAR